MTTDPLANKHGNYTPYHYTFNNPLRFIDPAGLDTTVYFFDQTQNPDDKSKMTATVYVDVDGEIEGPYSGSTHPNDPEKHNTLNEGTFEFNNADGHKGGSKKGLNIVKDKDGSGLANRVAPGTDPEGKAVEMTVVNVHEAFNESNRGSAGCPTICTSDASKFFSNFDFSGTGGTTGTSKGKVVVRRGYDIRTLYDKAKVKTKQLINKVF